MLSEHFNLTRYCQRIAYSGELEPSLACVSALMRQQLMQIPFENLSILAGETISLQPEDIVNKLITRQRGGYCYELNGLFAMMLSALGIPYQWLAARPLFLAERRPRTHAALVAQIEGQDWLLDVGWGSYGIRSPLKLDTSTAGVQQDDDRFQLVLDDNSEWILSALMNAEWKPQYSFQRTPVEWIDFAPANWLNCTHPQVIFTQKPVLVIFTARGRKILFGDQFKCYEDGKSSERTVKAGEMAVVIHQHFGLQWPLKAL